MATRRGFDHTARVDVLDGGAANTVLQGGEAIGVSAVLISAVQSSPDLTVLTDQTANAIIDGPGQIRLDDGVGGPDTTGDFVVVTWATG